MKLLMSPASPFVRKVRVLLRETDQLDQVEELEVTTTAFATDPQIIAVNPLGKIPALVRDDGPAIYDSRVITRFLDDLANANFYPRHHIWEVLTLEATADAIMEAAVSMAYEVRLRPQQEQSPAWIEAQWEKVTRAVAAIDSRWMSHLSGPMDISHIAVACALSYLDLRHDARNWRAGNVPLAAWHADFVERESMKATAPPA
ncbi:glutathione S-transferase [Yoonia sediminilitoris]|uniref:Glutathione S-transferase n=1 Tax=Yoonia sediminilitoris TaxID=1286148 RepID=A0A2T6KH80_9RHOB|nr:glutathione S-transferase [Yoonia sediminilitoris]PUB14857.1 glutathione S-transferase [Yoonia sediminilitoris]RCW95574.1 glutathione S-transferase [Yoonia sediminilitoris]